MDYPRQSLLYCVLLGNKKNFLANGFTACFAIAVVCVPVVWFRGEGNENYRGLQGAPQPQLQQTGCCRHVLYVNFLTNRFLKLLLTSCFLHDTMIAS